MLVTNPASRDVIATRTATPELDSYGEPTGRLKWATATTPLRLGHPRIERGPSTIADVEGRILAEDEALLIILRRWDADPMYTRVETNGSEAWTIVSRPVTRRALASGVHTVVKLKRIEVTA